MGRVQGKVALVTAAGRGHGEAIARRFALFLASDDAANLTGQDIRSGGAVMW